jgi:carboxypeptidase T
MARLSKGLAGAVLCFVATVGHGEDEPIAVGQHLYSSDQAVIVTLKPNNFREELRRLLSHSYDIAGVDVAEKTIDVVVSQGEAKRLSSLSSARVQSTKSFDPLAAPDSGYTTHQELTDIVTRTAEAFPNIVSYESIGKSLEGREIWAVKISDNVAKRETDEPVIFFNAMHHAREVMTTEVAIDIIEQLTKGYESNSQVQGWVNNNEIWIVPMVNPDGNNKVWTSNSMWRKNTRGGHGVDINRNYPYKWGECSGSSGSTSADDYRGPSAASEPETQNMMNFVSRIKPIMSISYHSYSELVLYPYSCKGEHTPDHNTVKNVGQQLAKRLPKDGSPGTYTPGTPWEILYGVDGGDIDWYYAEHDVLPFVIEVSSKLQGFQPAFSWRQRTVEKMRAGWKFLLDRAGRSGVRGLVLNEQGQAITSGQVSLRPLSQPEATAYATRIKPDGTYHIVCEPGMYKLSVMADGQVTEQDIAVGSGRLDTNIAL